MDFVLHLRPPIVAIDGLGIDKSGSTFDLRKRHLLHEMQGVNKREKSIPELKKCALYGASPTRIKVYQGSKNPSQKYTSHCCEACDKIDYLAKVCISKESNGAHHPSMNLDEPIKSNFVFVCEHKQC